MDEVLRALKYRAWHRGTREADMMIGGFFDAHHAAWDAHDRALFAALLTEQDVDIMAWAIGTQVARTLPGAHDGRLPQTRLHRDGQVSEALSPILKARRR